jgi:hypothetical protein
MIHVPSMSRDRVEIQFPSTTVPGTADTLATLVKVTNGVPAGGATSIPVAAGKTLRLQSAEITMRNSAASQGRVTVTLRSNPAGATVLGSQSLGQWEVSSQANVVGQCETIVVALPEGYEFSGTMTLGLSFASTVGTELTSAIMRGYEYTTPSAALR